MQVFQKAAAKLNQMYNVEKSQNVEFIKAVLIMKKKMSYRIQEAFQN